MMPGDELAEPGAKASAANVSYHGYIKDIQFNLLRVNPLRPSDAYIIMRR